MPTIADTAVKIASRASILIGGDAIQSFSDGTTEADVCNNIYEDVAQSCLTRTRWRFATNQAQLSRLAAAPTGRFDAAYQLPSDTLMINAITINDVPVKYDVYGNKAFCDADSSQVLVADYIFRVTEENWPPYFILGVEFFLASILAISVARDGALGSAMELKAEKQMIKARTLDSQQLTTSKLNTSRFIAQRRS